VLGVDNLVFISIAVGNLPHERRSSARKLGLGFACITRILLLLSLAHLARMDDRTSSLFHLFGQIISIRDLVLIGGGIFLVVTYSTQLVHPGGTFPDVNSAAFTIAKTIGGDLFSSLFLAGLIVTQFASGLAAQTAVARLLYAMGRDSVLPKRIFGYIHPRFQTPMINVLVSGVVGLIALKLDVATSTSFINFGAFSAFTCVNLCVIAMFVRQRREHGPSQRFVPNVVFPAIGAVIDVYLLLHLDGKAKLLGVIWLTCGVLYLTYLTRGFRRPPPEMEFVED
jgi:amino acid transporter